MTTRLDDGSRIEALSDSLKEIPACRFKHIEEFMEDFLKQLGEYQQKEKGGDTA